MVSSGFRDQNDDAYPKARKGRAAHGTRGTRSQGIVRTHATVVVTTAMRSDSSNTGSKTSGDEM